MNIIQAVNDERIFKPLFADLTTWGNWMVALKAIFGLEMTREELKVYRKFTGRTDRPDKQFSTAFLLCGRRGGKSFTASLCAVFLSCFREWDLGPGQKGYVMILACDKKQASVELDYIRSILSLPVFKNMVIRETSEEIELSNRMVLAVHTANYRSLRGFQACAVILSELGFYYIDGSNPAQEIITALSPSLGAVEGSLCLGISSVYSRSGPLFQAYRDKFGKNDPDTLVWKAATRAEYFAEFRTDLESFLPLEVIDAAIIRGRRELAPMPNIEYHAFCDPSGGRGDNMTLSICHRDGSSLVQDCLRVKFAPFDPSSAVCEFVQVLRTYGISSVEGDKYSANWCSGAFEREGIFYQSSQLSKSDVFLESLALFQQGRVQLLDHELQRNELAGLERRTGRNRDSVDHGPHGHDDAANSCAGSLVMAAQTDAARTPGPSLGIVERPVEENLDRDWQFHLLDRPVPQAAPGVSDAELQRELDELDREIEEEECKGKPGVSISWVKR